MFQIVSAAELSALADGAGIEGSLGVLYQLRETGAVYEWNPATRAMGRVNAGGAAGAAPTTIDSGNAATYNGGQLTIASGGTLTIALGASLPAGLSIYPHASGAGTLAVSGGATVSGGTTSKTLVAGGIYALVQVATDTYRLTGGAAV